jgi:hypothetical protein
MADDVNQKVLANDRQLPTPDGQNIQTNTRASRYGEQYVWPLPGGRTALGQEGTYFMARNAIIDVATTLAGHTAPVLVDIDVTVTKAFIHLINPVTPGGKFAYLDFLEIDVITPGAAGTSDMWTVQLDTGATRVTTPGTALAITNPNMQSAALPTLVPTGGVITVGVESSACRVLGHGAFRPSIAIAGDRYRFNFAENRSTGGSVVSTSTAHHVQDLGPVILGPTDQFILALGAPSQSAAGIYKVRLGWWER